MLSKRLVALAMIATLVGTTGVPAFAAPASASLGGGEEIVYKDQGLIASYVDQAAGSGISIMGIKSGSVDSGEYKGYWIRGDKKFGKEKHVYSSYKNYKHEGAASVTSGTGDYVDGHFQAPDHMSTAHTKWTLSGTNKANYRYR